MDDDLYNTLPSQPPPRPPAIQPKPRATASSSTDPGAPTGTPVEDPVEDPGVWCEILKLEGRVSNNKKADGFMWWLDKNLDSVVYDVTINFLI